jgi:hypothetical protein
MRGLGITASHKRFIRPGNEYNKYFGAPKGLDPIINKDASTLETVDIIAELVPKVSYQTKELSKILKGSTLKDTCKKIFDFCYKHIQYKLDDAGVEQLREPIRSWNDRKTGIDCDCFSIFVSSILTNLGIKHAYRICEINNKGYYQHIYIVVPVNQNSNSINGQYITIDPVLDEFNKEAPYITKTKDKMGIPVQVLNGIDDENFFGLGEIDQAETLEGVYRATKNTLKRHIRATKRKVQAQPASLGGMYDQTQFLGALDAAEALIEDGSDEALAKLYGMGEGMKNNPYAFLGDVDGLGKPKFLKKVAAAAKSVKNAVQQKAAQVQTAAKKGASNAQAAAKKAVQATKSVAKKAVQAVAKYNPVSTAARTGFLVAMKTNLFGYAAQLKWGYATPEQIAKFGITQDEYQKAKSALAKAENLFVNDLKGKKENLKNAILSGKNKLGGLNGLGEPVTAAATVGAAAPFLAKIRDFIKGLNIKPRKIAEFLKKAVTKKATPAANDAALIQTDPATTIQNNAIVESATDNSYPQNQPGDDNEYFESDSSSNSQADYVPPQPENKSNTGMMIGLGLLGVTVAALAFGGSKSKSRSMNGPGKKTSKSSKSRSKSKSKKTIIIK